MDKPRAFTEQEIQKKFIKTVLGIARYWETVKDPAGNNRCTGVAFSILALIDGANADFPSIKLLLDPHPDDKKYHEDNNENWYEPDMCFNNCSLHDKFSVMAMRKR